MKLSPKALEVWSHFSSSRWLVPVGVVACVAIFVGWQARASLPRWMQDVVSGSAVEAALYRLMDVPGMKVLYTRPPGEASSELTTLVAKAPGQADLYSLRALTEEQALDFKDAEADWKKYVLLAKDKAAAELELADYYHRRIQTQDEVKVLMEIGASPEQQGEHYTQPAEQRSWKAFERILPLAAEQFAPKDPIKNEIVGASYEAWAARYPGQSVVRVREFGWRLERRNFDGAEKVIEQYRSAFPDDAIFPLKATALLAYRRGSADTALAVYDKGFEPLWPAELVKSYYGLLIATHRQRRWTADARERLARNPDDLNAMARLFYYAQQQGHLDMAQQTIEAYRQSKDSRGAQWRAQELYTLAQLSEAIHAYPEAARYDFALYHAQGQLSNGSSAQTEGLSSMIRILLEAPDQPVELGSGNLSMYRDIATVDQGPGYWNGILSLWLNSTSPGQAYSQEEERARPYFHRAKAAALLDLLDKKYPEAKGRAELHRQMVGVFAGYGESALVLKAGKDFLTTFTGGPEQDSRIAVAMDMANAYARTQDTRGEFALYDQMLSELGSKTEGMPLTAASASGAGPTTKQKPETAEATDAAAESDDARTNDEQASASRAKADLERAFDVSASQPTKLSSKEAQEYQQLLERYLGRLTATGQLPQALAVLRRELDRNPNDPLLYERLARFLEENNMSAQQEQVYSEALTKFQGTDGLMGWYDKLARLYLRQKKREAFADLTRQVTGIFHGTELEQYFQQVNQGGPELFLQLNLYAHQRFPHDEVFVRNLLQAYDAKTTRNPAAWENLLREHWGDSAALRTRFFDYLNRTGKLDAEVSQLRALAASGQDAKTDPASVRELSEVAIWRSHFEEAAPLMGALAEAYPADVEIGTEASSMYRSLAYYDAGQTHRAVAIEKNLMAAEPANLDRIARIGDILSDSGAGDSAGHEDLAAAAPYWRGLAAVHPGNANGYLQAATVFWDYFQFDDALAEIREARTKFNQPAIFAYEAGALSEDKREMADAVREYAQGAIASEPNEPAALRLLQLARRKATAKMVDEETSRALASHQDVAALRLRERVLKVQKREAEIAPLLEAALTQAKTMDEVQAIGAEAQTQLLTAVYERSMEKQIALSEDPVQKIELSYELMRSLEDHKDVDAAARLVANVYRGNSKLQGVVRATTDFYWRNKRSSAAIATLMEASDASRKSQPELSRGYVLEAASKANASGSYAQARTLMGPLIDPSIAEKEGYDAYSAQSLAVVADSYARAGDDAGLKQFYLGELKSIHDAPLPMTPENRKQKTVLLRRGLIPELTRTKDYDGAIEQYIAILSGYPEDAAGTREAALYAMRYGKQQRLSDFVSKTVKASPKDSRFAILQAQVLTVFEDLNGAIDAYARAVGIRNDRADVYTAKAELEERTQRLDDACKDYERLYALSYQNPDWMVKVAEARARQGRREDAVKALERAWIAGHPQRAGDAFRVAVQLESWGMLDESLRYAEQGVKAEGDDLLAGRSSGNTDGDDAQGAAVYARLMTRMRRQDKALEVLDAARKAANVSPYSPSVLAAQVQKQGLGSVTDEEWRKHRVAERKQMATQRYNAALLEIGKAVSRYFTPEEKQRFASLVDARWKLVERAPLKDRLQWIEVAKYAGMRDVEARMRGQILLSRTSQAATNQTGGDQEQAEDNTNNESGSPGDDQMQPYIELQRSRMAFTELAQTLETYALQVKPEKREAARIAEAQAYRDQGDEIAEMHVLRRIGYAGDRNAALRERYLELLLKHDAAGFAAYGGASKDKATRFAAPNYALAHSNLKVTQAAFASRAAAIGARWDSAYNALAGLYFRDPSPAVEAAFHRVLADGKTIGERVEKPEKQPVAGVRNASDGSAPFAGDGWFYYGMRLGVYRTLSPEQEWTKWDPEEFLAAGIERNPGSAANYAALAAAYADAARTDAALAEYGHALELAPDSPAVYDAMAMLLWQSHRKEDAIAHWRMALASLNRIQDRGPAPESFWSEFAAIADHVGKRALTAQLHAEMDALLRNYIARNGNYRSNELLRAAYGAAANPSQGMEWVLSLSSVASGPAQVVGDLSSVDWIADAMREPLLLRVLELDRIAASHAGGQDSYLGSRVLAAQRELALYYFTQKQDAKAEAMLAKMPDTARNQDDLVQAEFEAAARGNRLSALLDQYRANADKPEALPAVQVFRDVAGTLASNGNKAGALAVWEYVYDRDQTQNALTAADYLGLAQARLLNGDTSGAVELAHKLLLQPGDVYARYEMAARLFEENHHPQEALEFLTILARYVPWDGSFALRHANAESLIGKDKAGAVAALRQAAANGNDAYTLRVKAAQSLSNASAPPDAAKGLGSGELDLLATGKIGPSAAQQPYYAAARISAAVTSIDPKQSVLLLEQALAITALEENAVDMYMNRSIEESASRSAEEVLRLQLFRAEVKAGHPSRALASIAPLLSSPYIYAPPESPERDGDEDDTVPPEEEAAASVVHYGGEERLAALENMAPMPHSTSAQSEDDAGRAERAGLALLIAAAYEHTGNTESELPYLKLAAFLQKNAAERSALQQRIDALQQRDRLEARNALRRPQVQETLDQPRLVRPMLSLADLVREEAAP